MSSDSETEAVIIGCLLVEEEERKQAIKKQKINIASEKLIDEVKRRPALYDGKSYDANVRRANWEEVTKIFFNDVWDSSNPTGKEALVKEVQVKWKSLRDAYNRVRKQEKDDQVKGATKSRKKYVFYDQLSFLEAVSKSAYSPNAIFLQEDRNDDSMDNECTSPSALVKTDQEMFEAHTSARSSDDVLLGIRDSDDRLSAILTELVKLQKEEKSDDRLGNKKFLLSLLPFMEKLPDDVNLEVRLQLMSILQTYSNGESFMKT